MDFKDIATVSGKGGLFRIIKPTKAGVILESIDENKLRVVAGFNHRISILDEISIYTTNKEESKPVKTILSKIYKEFKDDPGVDGKSSNQELKSFLKYILPSYDETKVYVSDIKKLISWYRVLLTYFPELLKKEQSQHEGNQDSEDE